MICCFPSDDENENATADCKCLSSHSNWVLSVFFIFFLQIYYLGITIQTDREGDDDENDDDSYENATASASPIFLPFHLPTIELDESLREGFPLNQ